MHLDYTNISLDPERNLLTTKWLRAVNSLEYRESVAYFYDIIRETKTDYWLVDATRLSSPALIDQKWTAELLGSDLESSSLKKMAVVLPDDLFLEMVAEKIMEDIFQLAGNRVSIKLFKNRDQAMDWLTSAHDTEGLFRKDFIEGDN